MIVLNRAFGARDSKRRGGAQLTALLV